MLPFPTARSPHFDGFEWKFYHIRCLPAKALKAGLAGFAPGFALKHSDQVAFYEKLGLEVPKKDLSQEESALEQVYEYAKQMVEEPLTGKQVESMLQANGTKVGDGKEKIPKINQYLMIADGLLNGRMPPCPLCKGVHSRQLQVGGFFQEPTVFCNGWFNPSTRCEMVVSGIEAITLLEARERWVVPADCIKKKGWYADNWKEAPPPHQLSLPLVPLQGENNATTGDTSKKRAAETETTIKPPSKKAKIIPGAACLQADEEAPVGEVYVGDDGTVAYNTTLTLTNLAESINKFYVIQVLKTPSGQMPYCTYRKWGRVGQERDTYNYYATGGDTKVTYYLEAADAVAEFVDVFGKCTGVHWAHRDEFSQQPGEHP